MKTGIIVCRIQTSHLHEGHVKLMRYVSNINDRFIVILGASPTRLTRKNPLSFDSRKAMVNEEFPNAEVHSMNDYKYDSFWDEQLDKLITTLCSPEENVILYGDREGFIEQYKGKYRAEFADVTVHGISATKIRLGHHMCERNNKEWRAGIIWASNHKYPVSFQTVDVAILKEGKEVLLGKKEGEPLLRFIGGFVYPTDDSLEQSAKREVGEECGHIETDDYNYLGSFRIDDWRYRNEPDKIMTAFFACKYIFGHVMACDDIAQVSWHSISELKETDIEPEHRILFNTLIKHLKTT